MSKHTNYTPARIQYLLKEAGVTQKQIARELGVSEMSVSDVINFRMVSKRLMREISKRIDADPKTVFAWYFCQERPRRPSKRR
jgi:transcriptional regulator with XRE-family HTH domain